MVAANKKTSEPRVTLD